MKSKYKREDIALILSQGAATIEFTKVDGSQRVMRCTISSHLIPEEYLPNHSYNSQYSYSDLDYNPNVIRVFDLGLNEWRSFRVTSVTELTVLDDRGYVTKPLG
jgi:hypothetical protein